MNNVMRDKLEREREEDAKLAGMSQQPPTFGAAPVEDQQSKKTRVTHEELQKITNLICETMVRFARRGQESV